MDSHLLHSSHVQTKILIVNRSYAVVHTLALIALIYYRLSYFFQESKIRETPMFLWLLVFVSELLLSFLWLLDQAFRWRPISRTVFPERLPEDGKLPSIDVFICTADPDKEPTFEVMNTVISAMALDYPPAKLNVYLSDDGGSHVTLLGMKEAWRFAKCWLPFCRTYGIKTKSPEAYFSDFKEDDNLLHDYTESKFIEEMKKIKEKYKTFKDNIVRAGGTGGMGNKIIKTKRDHPPVFEIIHDKDIDSLETLDEADMPLLVYVSREKRPSYPHHFKAGALNVLLRVSGIISNCPYILVLDCDMYCNDSGSARRAMCFHLDPTISPSLAFVQFPQMFRNISDNDIYDSQLRSAFKILWQGLDGTQGPILSGTGFYIKRDALYGASFAEKDIDLKELKRFFGRSNEFIKSLLSKKSAINGRDSSIALFLDESGLLASCAYEDHTKWGKEIGFFYHSVVEDYFTGFRLHCKGWKSVYCYPTNPQFLGSGTTTLNDSLTQSIRWSSGLLEVGLSRFCPLIYGIGKMSFFQSMCYGHLALFPLYCIPLWCFATIPQLCLLNNISLYPEVSSSYFIVFLFVLLSSQFKLLQEVLATGGSIRLWMNEQRMWMIKSTTCYLYGTLDVLLKKIGVREASFLPTNKVEDHEQLKLYQSGKFNFQASIIFLVPLVSIVILNMISCIGGVAQIIFMNDWEKIFAQCFLSFYILIMSYPIIEGMVLRKDKGKVELFVTLMSSVFTTVFLLLGFIILKITF